MNLKSRAGAAKLGIQLMILSILTVGGFLYWLSRTAEPTQIVEVEEEPAMDSMVNVVAVADFSMGTAAYIDQEVTLEDVEIASVLGARSLWMNLDTGTPFLLYLADTALPDSMSFVAGDRLTVTGSVMAMSDSILDAWEAGGAFLQDTDRIQAEFAEDFLEVHTISGSMAEADAGTDGEMVSEPSS